MKKLTSQLQDGTKNIVFSWCLKKNLKITQQKYEENAVYQRKRKI